MTDKEIQEFQMDCNCYLNGYGFEVEKGIMIFDRITDAKYKPKKVKLTPYLVKQLEKVEEKYFSNDCNRVAEVARICFGIEFN